MDSKTYWQKREAANLVSNLKQEKEYERELDRIYRDMLDGVQKEVESFYARYASKEGITITEARKAVSQLDIEAYERKAKRYVKDKDFSKIANEEMRLYNLTMKVNRLEMLRANIGLEMLRGHSELETFMGKILRGRTEAELKRQAGILGKSVRNNAKLANSIVNASYKNATFSQRVWLYYGQMKADVGKMLENGLLQGRGVRKLTKELEKYYIGEPKLKNGEDGAKYAAERLMRTELARVQSDAQKQSFERNGFEQYTFIVNGGCCPICEAVAKKNNGHYKVKDMMPGDNAPPMHPFCRCSIAAYEDSDEYNAWLEYLDQDGTTEEWNKLKELDTVRKLNAAKKEWLKNHDYDIYGDSLSEMENGFWDEASDGSMKKESAWLNAINNKIAGISKVGTTNAAHNPVTIGGVNCTKTIKKHGFSDGTSGGVKKTVDSVVYTTPDGTNFIFPKSYKKNQQQMTPEIAIRCWQRVPQSIKAKAQKTIEFVDYYNPQDAIWRKRYKNFGHSYATGGDKITFYRYDYAHNENYVVRTYCHEAGHFIDRNMATTLRNFSDESIWTKAMADDKIISGKKSCTKYGENSNAEDFAESIAEYIKDSAAFTKEYPNRAAIIAGFI